MRKRQCSAQSKCGGSIDLLLGRRGTVIRRSDRQAVKAINPLRAVAAASKKAEKAIDRLKKSAKATGDTLADMGSQG